MTNEAFKEAASLRDKISNLENFMFWCSGKRDIGRKYSASVIKLKRNWVGGVESKEYELPERLQKQISNCVQAELDLLNAELDNL